MANHFFGRKLRVRLPFRPTARRPETITCRACAREFLAMGARGQYPARCSTCTPRHNRILAKFKISLEEWLALSERQGGVCAICRRPEQRQGRSLAVDHDHATGRIRGLLCGSCNQGLGLLGDDPTRLQAAITYLSP